MMCSRELNSEVAANGPCSEEAYWYGRCRAMETDVDVSISRIFLIFREYFGRDTIGFQSEALDI